MVASRLSRAGGASIGAKEGLRGSYAGRAHPGVALSSCAKGGLLSRYRPMGRNRHLALCRRSGKNAAKFVSKGGTRNASPENDTSAFRRRTCGCNGARTATEFCRRAERRTDQDRLLH